MNTLSSSSEQLRSLLARLQRGPKPGTTASLAEGFAALDSITKLEAVLAIEAEFEIDLGEGELGQVRHFDQLAALIDRKRAERPATVATEEAKLPTDSRPVPVVPVAAWGRGPAALLVGAMKTWFRIRVTGREFVPPAEGCLLCANHASHLDGLALLVAVGPWRDRLVFAAAKDYFFSRSTLARFSTRALPMIPWERSGDVPAMKENLRQLAACRAAGAIVVFFPEGGRSTSGELQAFRDGLSFFAGRLDLPVVPCWIEGAARALPKGRIWPRPGRLSVAFGPALRNSANEPGFADTVRERMLQLRNAKA